MAPHLSMFSATGTAGMTAVLALLAASFPTRAETDCPQAELVAPTGPTIADPRPTLRWRQLEGVARYRVQVHSRVPEGETVVAIDTLVEGAQFTPARPLADHRAIVKVLVTAPCDEAIGLDDGARLFIDTGLSCRMPSLAFDPQSGRWSWPAAAGVLSYEVLRYTMPDGKLVARDIVRQPPSLSIDARSIVVAVRARCEQGMSDWQFAP